MTNAVRQGRSFTAAGLAFAASLLAGCASTSAPTQPAQKPPPLANFGCRRGVEAFVAQAGLRLDQLDDIRLAAEPVAGGDQVAFYRLTARPQSCTGGDLRLIVMPDCSVESWRTTSPCRLPNLEPLP